MQSFGTKYFGKIIHITHRQHRKGDQPNYEHFRSDPRRRAENAFVGRVTFSEIGRKLQEASHRSADIIY
jgi:hypothetical protein